ncbi:MAG: hypothetical protein Q8O74_04620, partial [bacterium]|nr:hypothetical protein [bacterium]
LLNHRLYRGQAGTETEWSKEKYPKHKYIDEIQCFHTFCRISGTPSLVVACFIGKFRNNSILDIN